MKKNFSTVWKNKRKVLIIVISMISVLILPMINTSAYTKDNNLDIGIIYDDSLEILCSSGLSFYADNIKDKSNIQHTLEFNLSFDKVDKIENINDTIKEIINSKSFEKLNDKEMIKTLEEEINTKLVEQTRKEVKVKIDYYAIDEEILYNIRNDSSNENVNNSQKEYYEENPYVASEFEYDNNNKYIVSTKYNLGSVGIGDKNYVYAINIKALPEIENTNLSSEMNTEESLMVVKDRAQKAILNLSNSSVEFENTSYIEKLALKALNEEFNLSEGNYFKLNIVINIKKDKLSKENKELKERVQSLES